MPFKLTPEIFESLWQESELKGQASWIDTDIDAIDQATLSHIGKFCQCHTELQDGLGIEIQEWEVAEDLLHSTDEGEDGTEAGLVFFLSGKVRTNLHGLTGEIEEIVGHYYLESSAGIPETELWAAGEPFRRIYLQLNPLQLFGDLSTQQVAQLPVELWQTLEGNHRPYYCLGITTPEMHRVLQQILHCPYEGLLKRLYLQGKAWELMALAFEQFQLGVLDPAIKRIKPSGIEQIHHAREILIRNLEHPPSLTNLARQVGLNEFALKHGFQRVFGTTAFRYLHDHRLEVARKLLIADDLPIQTVARQVGFTSRGYFAAAFRKKFGLSPKAYSLQRNSVS